METLLNTDRTLDPAIISRRRRKFITRIAATVVIILVGITVLYSWIRPSVDRDALRIGVVGWGAVEETIEASGLALPEHEQIITSPIDSRVLQIFHRAGDRLAKGEPILALDSSEAHLALERIADNLTVKENERAQLEAQLATEKADLQSRFEVKQMQADLLAAKAEQQRKLFALGASSKDQVNQAELEEKVAKIELEQLRASAQNNDQVAQARLASVQTEIALFKKEYAEMQRQLLLASTRVEQDGILTWVIDQQGATVRKSDPIARFSSQAGFRIEATLSDVHAGKVLPGMKARVRVNRADLPGRVTSVNPTIQHGVLTMNIALDNPSDERLHSNIRTDVYVILARKDSVLRVDRGTIAESGGVQQIFVVRGSTAVRQELAVGLVGYEHAEVVRGLVAGDTVVVSPMTEYEHLASVKID